MENKTIAVILVIGIIVVGAILFSGGGATVSARGESVLDVRPDEVSVYVTAEGKGDSAQEAKVELDEISDDVLTELVKLGLERREIEFVNLNIYEDFDWTNGGRVSKGFVASQNLNVKTDNFDRVPGIVDAAVDSGALVSYISFEISDELRSEYKVQALEKAGQDAKAKAEATASGLGKNLGSLVSVQSEDFNYYPYRHFEATAVSADAAGGAAKEAALNIYPSDVEVRASIMVEYKLSRF